MVGPPPPPLCGGMERGNARILPLPGASKVPGEGEKGVVSRCTCSKIMHAHHVGVGGGGGIHKVSGGVHLDVGVLGLPHRVSAHGIEELVKGGGLRGQMKKFKGGELAAEFPPQICGPGLPPKIGVAGRAAQVDVNHTGGGVQGCCPAHNIIHSQCPRLVGCLLQWVAGDGEGLVVGEGVGSGIGAGLQAGELGQCLLGHGQKKMQRKALRAVRKQNSANWGKFARDSYEIHTNFVRISHSRECVNLA